METSSNNYAFIDAQNLHLGTKSEGWKIDNTRFRIYLREKYKVAAAYYFLGCYSDEYKDLYDSIQKSGFIIKFRDHDSTMSGFKKGNVDTDIVFEMMKNYVDELTMGKVILVSGDGDYHRVVEYLIQKGKFEKVLFPNHKFSSLYKKLSDFFYDKLYRPEIKRKIQLFEK